MSLTILIFLFLSFFGFRTTETEEATAVSVAVAPPTPAAIACTVAPRSLDEIATIQATPAAEAEVTATPDTDRPVDPDTVAQLQVVLHMADSCAAEGDYGRLAALYSADAIQAGVLDAESVQIEPGTPEATPQIELPAKFGPPTVRAAWWIDDTRVLAEIERGPWLREVRFVRVNDAWLIDSVETPGGVTAPTPPTAAVLPLPVLQAIIGVIAGETGGGTESITITSVEEHAWPDTSLGCPKEGEFYAQVITPGYRVIVTYEGQQFEIHTDRTGNAVLCAS